MTRNAPPTNGSLSTRTPLYMHSHILLLHDLVPRIQTPTMPYSRAGLSSALSIRDSTRPGEVDLIPLPQQADAQLQLQLQHTPETSFRSRLRRRLSISSLHYYSTVSISISISISIPDIKSDRKENNKETFLRQRKSSQLPRRKSFKPVARRGKT
jgi:hypothetical protein